MGDQPDTLNQPDTLHALLSKLSDSQTVTVGAIRALAVFDKRGGAHGKPRARNMDRTAGPPFSDFQWCDTHGVARSPKCVSKQG